MVDLSGGRAVSDKISVIVPVYNVENYLRRCVDSIINQTYKNLEIILVDDGSPDNCPVICDEYAQRDSRIKVIHKENGGLSDARNVGIDIASGDYLMFVDSDDYISEKMCGILYERLRSSNADMSICGVERIYPDGRNSDYSNIEDALLTRDDFFDKMEGKCGWCWVVAWNKLYKKSIFDGLCYPVGKLYEDDFIIHKLLYKIEKISAVADHMYYYVQRADSIVNQCYSVKNLDSVQVFLERGEFFVRHGASCSRINFCLKTALMFLYLNFKNLEITPETEQRYEELISYYKNLWNNVKKYKFSFVDRIYFSLNAFSPHMVYRVRKVMGYLRNR